MTFASSASPSEPSTVPLDASMDPFVSAPLPAPLRDRSMNAVPPIPAAVDAPRASRTAASLTRRRIASSSPKLVERSSVSIRNSNEARP